MTVDVDQALDGILGEGVELTLDQLEVLVRPWTEAAGAAVETSFGEAGWYGNTAQPYAPRTIPVDVPRLWLARSNPADPDAWTDTSCHVGTFP